MAQSKQNSRLVMAILLVLCTIVLMMQGTPQIAYASSENSFDTTNVLDDLLSSTIDGKPFDLKDYPYNENGMLRIVSFIEYCYSFKSNMRANYGLYLLIYNPQALNLSTNSKQNKIQMAVSYDKNGTPTRYEKFDLQFCSKSSNDYKNLFYKYKILDRKIADKTFAERVNTNERRYDISGIELVTYGDKNATEYGVGGTYTFTGYSEGYGPDANAKSTLNCVVQDLETLKLEVHHTSFRTNVSSKGKDHYNEVNSVYFSIPERIYQEYGKLQKIRAEWWEYKTKLAAITSNEAFYQKMLAGSKLKTEKDQNNPQIPYRLFTGYKVEQTSNQFHGYTSIEYDWCFNERTNYEETTGGAVFNSTKVSKANSQSDMMPMVFYSPYVDLDEVFDFLFSKPVAGDVAANRVAEYIYGYSNELGNGYIDCNGREISKDLFESFVDEGRQMGHNDKTIDLADTFNLMSYDSNHSWWDKLWDYGFSWPQTSGDYKDISPIYEVKADDLIADDYGVSQRLLVNKNDVASLRAFHAKESALNRRVVLFRFANTDYFSQACGRSDNEGNYVPEDEADTYIASETIFLDFDIIELTFNKDGVYHVIPVVSSPTDVINGFTVPAQKLEWWKIIIAVIILVICFILLAPILPYIFKGIWLVICAPFKAIKSVKGRRKAKHKSQVDNSDKTRKEIQ